MLSKPAFYAAGLVLVQGAPKMVDPAPTYSDDAATYVTYGCMRCIRSGFNWVAATSDWNKHDHASKPSSFCCAG